MNAWRTVCVRSVCYLFTILAYDPSKLTVMNLFVFDSDMIYGSIVFAYRIEGIRFVKIFYKLN
jgi:hypothetical protein